MATSPDNQRLKWQQNRQQTGNTPVTLTLKPAWTGLVGRFNDHRCDKNLTTLFQDFMDARKDHGKPGKLKPTRHVSALLAEMGLGRPHRGRFRDGRTNEFDHGFQDEKAQFTASAEPAPVKVSPGNAATAF
jgi:hypothetical protein